MRIGFITIATIGILLSGRAFAQGVDDLFAGKLVDPKVGQWAWYEITDASGGNKHVIRQAVVGEEKVKRKTGYWVEFELIPPLGFKTVYKMLLTGPANDADNVHKILAQQGKGAVETVPVEEVFGARADKTPPKRTAAGTDTVDVDGKPVTAERFTVESKAGPVEIWVNTAVPPTGIVRVKSSEGEMILRSYGEGGDAAKTAMVQMGAPAQPKMSVKVGKETAGKAKKEESE